MNKWAQSILAVVLAAGLFLAGAWYNQQATVKGGVDEGRRIIYYQDPMHPAYKSDKPGIAPDCGMRLEPVYADSESEPRDGRALSTTGSVHITAGQQRTIGLETETVTPAAGVHTLRVLGRVALDETRIYPLASVTDGYLRKLGPIVTGSIVRKGDLLATYYNREFLNAQQTYLIALAAMDRVKDSAGEGQLKLNRDQIRAAEENLEFLGMGETQIREVARTRHIARDVEFRSPVTGLVLARNAFSALRFDRGAELFRIADINRVWIVADVFENDARLVRSARSATVRYQDREFPVRISNTLSQFDPASRAL